VPYFRGVENRERERERERKREEIARQWRTIHRCKNDDDEENASTAYVKATSTCLIVKRSAILLVPTREPPLLTNLPSPPFAPAVPLNTSFQIFDTSPSLAADTVAKYRAVATPIERCIYKYTHQKTTIDSAPRDHASSSWKVESGARFSPSLQGREGSSAAPSRRYYYSTEPAGENPWQYGRQSGKGRGIDLASTLRSVLSNVA